MWENNEVKLSGVIIYNKLHFDSLIRISASKSIKNVLSRLAY